MFLFVQKWNWDRINWRSRPSFPFQWIRSRKKESFNLLLFYSSLKIQTKVFWGHLKESVSLSNRTVDHKKRKEAYFWKFNENCGSKRSNQGLLHFFLSIFEQDTSPIYTHAHARARRERTKACISFDRFLSRPRRRKSTLSSKCIQLGSASVSKSEKEKGRENAKKEKN